jgi:hypothetical protein
VSIVDPDVEAVAMDVPGAICARCAALKERATINASTPGLPTQAVIIGIIKKSLHYGHRAGRKAMRRLLERPNKHLLHCHRSGSQRQKATHISDIYL